MSKPRILADILKDYFQNSNEPLAVAYREHIAHSDCCPFCLNSPQSRSSVTAFTERSRSGQILSLVAERSRSVNVEGTLSDWLDNQDVMQALHISPRTLQTLRSNGTLPFSRIGNKIYYHQQDILKILSDNYTMQKIKNYESK